MAPHRYAGYSLFVKVVVRDIQSLYQFLAEKLHAIEAIQSTETFVLLDTSLCRETPL